MLTEIEWNQLKTAILCMDAYNVNGKDQINRNNLIILVETFCEPKEEGTYVVNK